VTNYFYFLLLQQSIKAFIPFMKKCSFRFLHRISRIDHVSYHPVKTPLLLKRSFVNENSVFQQARNAFKHTSIMVPIGLGVVLIALSLVQEQKDEIHTKVEGPLYLRLYASLPLRYLSQLWGQLNDVPVPIPLRAPLYKTYSWLFGCLLDEMEQDLESYENLGQFFYRTIRKECRVIASPDQASIVSPSDGRVLHCGVVEHDEIEQVKGVTYSLNALLGPHPASQVDPHTHPTYIPQKGKQLFFCVVYLAPGDYHRFHSPTEWKIHRLRHFAGEMFSVSPAMVSQLRHLFSLNERVSLLGEWAQGFFAMVPVAATNVGKIKLDCAPVFLINKNLMTNVPKLDRPLGTSLEEMVVKQDGGAVEYVRGREMGGFQLGSTLVLVFEAHKGFEFFVEPGQRVWLGQPIGK
jgi:phosphatidylserine decarboxylase